MQLLIGRPYQHILWYNFNIIFITIIFIIISIVFKEKFLSIIQILGLLSYILQYSYFNLYFFNQYKSYIKYSIGLIPELFPIAVIGISFGSIKLIKNLMNFRKKSIILSFLFLYIIRTFNIFYNINGIFYQGISLNICGNLLFIFFSLTPFDNIKNKKIIQIIKQITSYTGGIYYLHTIISIYINKVLFKIKLLFKYIGICSSIVNYLSCYIICCIGINIFKKTKFKYLFY